MKRILITKNCLPTKETRNLCNNFSPSSAKTYSPNTFEDEYYEKWNQLGCFQPKKRKDVFSMILPPPNITGTLHLGHALTITTQDVLARWKRMCGHEVLWVPGLDHAGIATQVAVEQYLMKRGISRESLGQEKFLEEVWKWKHEKSSEITSQIKSLGASVDWSREYFTMEKAQSKAVNEAIMILWNKGLIYRDEALVNWSPYLRSTISDIEIDNIEINGPTEISVPGYDKPVKFGELVEFAYKVVGSDEEILVSTTRVETIPGDIAVAVNPNDKRYQHLWGSVLLHPFTGAEISLVLDYNVDPNFGTGAVKVTPSHDKTDFEIGKNHNLESLPVISDEGILINSMQFSGMKRFDARAEIMNALAEKGLLRSIKPHKMTIPICSRSGDVIEFLVKPQWFLKSKGMAEKAIAAVKENKIVITPERYTANWFNWLENIRDWCISRQLWWGHQVPFYCTEGDGKQLWFSARSEEEAKEVAKNAFAGPVSISRGTDVLDTWFSSSLLPFTCFGWPQKTQDFGKYYPLSTLVTGNDILFFWVARMAMLGLELTDQVPFKEVMLHGLICDSRGKKMSKSLGNALSPEDVIKGKKINDLLERIDSSFLNKDEIKIAKENVVKCHPEGITDCGVDALRFTLVSSNIKSHSVSFDVKDCEGAKRFCNKLFQVCKFTKMWLEKHSVNISTATPPNPVGLTDKWILARLKVTIDNVNCSLGVGDLHISATCLRNFIHHELCDVYVESIKPVLQGNSDSAEHSLKVLMYVLETSLKSLSPFMPFISEQLYHTLLPNKYESLMLAPFPSIPDKVVDHKAVEEMNRILKLVNSIRKLKHGSGIGDKRIKVWYDGPQDILDSKDLIETLSRCTLNLGNIASLESHEKEAVDSESFIYIDLNECKVGDSQDPTLIPKKISKLQKNLDKMLQMVSNKGYKESVPLNIQKSHEEKILKLKLELKKMDSYMEKKSMKA